MKIVRKSCAEGAKEAEGMVVVIDVFRAFSCAPLFFHFGAKRVILEADPKKATDLKREHPEWVLVGEVDEVPIEAGDLGNSPTHIMLKGGSFFEGKTVLHRTTAGVTGVAAVSGRASEVVLGSFVMAEAISKFIKMRNPEVVTLLAMGTRAKERAPEDEACADYLEHLLSARPYDPARVFKEIAFHRTTQKFLSGMKEYLPKEDPIFCLQRDLFDFALTVKRTGDRLEVAQQGV